MRPKEDLIMLTGAAGFIGSYLLGYLNQQGYTNIMVVDDFGDAEKEDNYRDKQFTQKVERKDLFSWLQQYDPPVRFVFHLGARTDTTEFDYAVHEALNVEYSKNIWQYCVRKNIPLVYASSAATYGNGAYGYADDHELPWKLQPLNPYGVSKNEFDKWALREKTEPPFWAGLKFFNVYGPNEYHKGRMASVVLHAFNQVQADGEVKLFRSHNPQYKDGEQLRDFVYVKDVAAVCYWFMHHTAASGLYNLGTGRARSFNDLVHAIFSSLEKPSVIRYIDTPVDIRDKYQYFTEADMHKLQQAGYSAPFTTLEEGVADYVKNFLVSHKYF